MKTSIKTITSSLAAIAVIATISVFFAFRPFTNNAESQGKRVTSTWYFIGNAVSDITNGSQWTKDNPNHEDCSSMNEPLPCQLEVDEAVTTTSELDDYFVSEYSDNAASIRAAASSRRPLPE